VAVTALWLLQKEAVIFVYFEQQIKSAVMNITLPCPLAPSHKYFSGFHCRLLSSIWPRAHRKRPEHTTSKHRAATYAVSSSLLPLFLS